MPLMDAMPLHVLYMAAMPQRLPYMAAMPRHGGNAATWRQCRDMAAMPRHVYCIMYIAAMPRQMIDAFMSMHACTHVPMYCHFYAHTKNQTPMPLESQPRAYVVEKNLTISKHVCKGKAATAATASTAAAAVGEGAAGRAAAWRGAHACTQIG